MKIDLAWAEGANKANRSIQNEIDAGNSILTFNNADKVKLAAQALQLHLGVRFQFLFDQIARAGRGIRI